MQACRPIQIPEPRLIGKLIGDQASGPHIGPDRHYALGEAREQQQGIKEHKARFQVRIQAFVNQHLDDIPLVVEDIPIVAIHTDIGLHNIIISSEAPTEIRAVIDWEFVASAPYASLHSMIERPFRQRADNLFGPEFDRADELRNAFWDSITH